MHSRIAELLDYLDARRTLLRAAVERVPAERRTQRPAPDRWSVAEVLEHLWLVEDVVGRVITTQIAEARAKGLGTETATGPALEMLDLHRVLDRDRPLVASERVQPREGLDATAALAALERTRAPLRDAVLAADGLALGDVVLPHPVLGPLTLYGWIGFVGGHEARHTAQIDEIAAALAAGEATPASPA